ncbi:MAG: hypothetical protein B9J98_01545 [Candidatus Terraquivivens tikiterensis]|uniref:DUF3786 domain-containing protein n=1 Tax=Candidatus Terraquivivens tikiterensis TaxID=1980982 RepID=A0A2R7Y969_9ARCH|nr:MAG: hypothetical protein B9J98_01545 [Candidatus Terraquivivens tikiterensis]
MSRYQTIRLPDELMVAETKKAFAELSQRNLDDVAKKCSVAYIPSREQGVKGRFIITVFNRTYSVELSEECVVDLLTDKPAPKNVQYIIVKYLITGDGTPLGTGWVNYRDVVGAAPYVKEFEDFVLRRLANRFGNAVEVYEYACKVLGGKKEKLGGVSFSFSVLPRVRILCQLWAAEKQDYVPAVANVSFSMNSDRFLPARELGMVALLLVDMLEKEASKYAQPGQR